MLVGNAERYQFLLLLKPEATNERVDRSGILELVDSHCKLHDVEILRSGERCGQELSDMGALEGLYLRLSVVASVGERVLTPLERERLELIQPKKETRSADEACCEFGCSGTALCAEGDQHDVVKLGPGAYAAYFVDRDVIVLNHFFPEFRDRFYATDASVLAFECQAKGKRLHELREEFVGHIDPNRAQPGSLRASILASASELGLEEVSVARNAFHISPGYLEAAFQLALLFPGREVSSERLGTGASMFEAAQFMLGADAVQVSRLFAETEPLCSAQSLEAFDRWAMAVNANRQKKFGNPT